VVFPLVGVPPPTNPLAQAQTASPPKADRSDEYALRNFANPLRFWCYRKSV